MSRFEYHFVSFKPVPAKNNELHVSTINDKSVDGFHDGSTPSLSRYANELGDQGWELIFYEPATHFSDILAVRVVFKRPKE
jgi:hypothetical protein